MPERGIGTVGILRAGASGLVLLCLSGCAARPLGFPIAQLERESRYCGEYRGYLRLEGPKALAVAGDPCGVFVAGLAHGGVDGDTAERLALEYCEQRRADRRVAAPCRIHASGGCPTPMSELRYCRRELSRSGDGCPRLPERPDAECDRD